MITAIIATRDDEENLAHALAALAPAAMEGIVRDAIVVDAGSRDGTLAVADEAGCALVEGSGAEALMRAADMARGDWLLFLSPASLLESGWQGEALAFVDRAFMAGNGADQCGDLPPPPRRGGCRGKDRRGRRQLPHAAFRGGLWRAGPAHIAWLLPGARRPPRPCRDGRRRPCATDRPAEADAAPGPRHGAATGRWRLRAGADREERGLPCAVRAPPAATADRPIGGVTGRVYPRIRACPVRRRNPWQSSSIGRNRFRAVKSLTTTTSPRPSWPGGRRSRNWRFSSTTSAPIRSATGSW